MSKMMLIDDEKKALVSAHALFSKMLDNFEIDTFIDPFAGLKQLEEEDYDAVITDLRMDNSMDGLELLRILHSVYPSVKRIVLSGFIDTEPYATALKELPVDFIIPKPLPMTVSPDTKTIKKELVAILNPKNKSTSDSSLRNISSTHKFIARVRGAIVAFADTEYNLIENIKALHIRDENIYVSYTDAEPVLRIRRPIKF